MDEIRSHRGMGKMMAMLSAFSMFGNRSTFSKPSGYKPGRSRRFKNSRHGGAFGSSGKGGTMKKLSRRMHRRQYFATNLRRHR